jgi:hypothetical protein
MTYQETANQIIKESIKSAIFIDENALSYFEKESDEIVYEEQLSKELYNNFKENGISLAIQKFKVGNENNISLKEYLFNARDLVLLDWKLDGLHGEEYSLKLLADVVTSEHIHFCVIYTSEPNINSIYANIVTFFSGKNSSDYETIKEEFEAYEDNLKPIFEQFNLFDNSSNGKLIKDINSLGDDFLASLKELDKNKLDAFKHLMIAFSNYHKSELSISYSIGSFDNKTLLINNTILTIVNKEDTDYSKDAANIIERFSENIVNSNFSFTQLLGLELKNTLLSKGAYIDSDFLNVSKETLAYHRNQILDEYGSDISFRELLKNVYIEQASLKLGVSKLKILEANIFDEFNKNATPSNNELASMNVYYNSVKLQSKSKQLDFGDVFVTNNKSDYYICITALCDCIRPTKTDYIFYFAKGMAMPIEKAIILGDTAFISFISKEKAIVWSNIDKIESTEPLEKQKELEQFRYKPVYIKPLTYLVENPSIIDGKLQLARIFQIEKEKGDLEFMELNYISTIKPTYAQRISNHAFTHPVRVGVDFVKKK